MNTFTILFLRDCFVLIIGRLACFSIIVISKVRSCFEKYLLYIYGIYCIAKECSCGHFSKSSVKYSTI